MSKISLNIIYGAVLIICISIILHIPLKGSEIPYLRKLGSATQLMVDGKPFLIIGGELGNSSASDAEYMRPVWPRLEALHMNTLLAPVYWELLEPEENHFDFTLVDSLILNARQYNMHLILLWFGSWKNSMSCYAPYWVKADPFRFPRAQSKEGKSMEILSCFSEEAMRADQKAFTTLMSYIKKVDTKDRTVLMIQVENEIGMIPEARDYSAIASGLYKKEVPNELMIYLQTHKESLIPEFDRVWASAGYKTSGSWEEIFGTGPGTDEIFMAWHYATYVNAIASTGKAEYHLPMYVNAALIRPGYLPGQYPSAGPLPHIMDIWRAGAPDIDFLSPDIYFPNFEEWCEKYHRSGNPLFIPEAARDAAAAVNIFYALGQHDAMGYCPFSIESTQDPVNDPIGRSYAVISQLAPMILEKQGKGQMAGVLVDELNPVKETTLGEYTFVCSHEYTNKWTEKAPGDKWPRKGCMIISVGPDEFFIAGSGVIVTFEPAVKDAFIAGIGSLDEGQLIEGKWNPGRRMNGDQSHQGRHMRLSHWEYGIQKVKLYRYH